MKRTLACALVLSLVALSIGEDVRSVTKTTYAAIDRAFKKRDIKAVQAAMGSRVAPAFRAIVAGHGVTYDQLLDNFRGLFYAFPTISESKTQVESVKVTGNVAKLRVFSRLNAYAKSPDKKNHFIELTNTSEDVWKNMSGRWKLLTSTTLTESRKVDGKLIKTH